MQIHITDFVAGARAAVGLAVVIDVFRAFSLAPHAFARGAARIIPVGEIDAAHALKADHPDWLLIGERFGRPLPGVDGGNSPALLEHFDLRGRTLIHTTHAGTQGLVNASNATEVITGALINAAAVVRYARQRGFDTVTLVRMGQGATQRCMEDDLCAELLAARLRGESPDTAQLRERLRQAPAAQKFFDPLCDWAPAADFDLCTDLDRYDFVLRLERDTQPAGLTRVDV